MKVKYRKLAIRQLDETMSRYKPLEAVQLRKGWIRAIRDALGMTGEQLAKRLGVNKQRVSRLERDEVLGKVTLKTLHKVAGALDCRFVYGFVPRESLERMVEKNARALAAKRMKRSNQTMRLEKQELSEKEQREAFEVIVGDITSTMPRSLWDDHDED
jgi:predicted DNA-binding mobile mystery protein A